MPLGIGFMGNSDYEHISFFVASQMPLGIGFMGNSMDWGGFPSRSTRSQMPLGIGFMGNFGLLLILSTLGASQMPLGIGFLGNSPIDCQLSSFGFRVTNASRHWVLGEQMPNHCNNQLTLGHKCLSALGSWGTFRTLANYPRFRNWVTNASRHWVLGEPFWECRKPHTLERHKCLSALGSWGTVSM